MKKEIICMGITSMFLLTSLIALQGVGLSIAVTESNLDDSITIDPADPTGENDWYITPVDITFHTQDNYRLGYIYYNISTEDVGYTGWIEVDIRDENCKVYDYMMTLTVDGIHTVYFYAVDYVGNNGSIHQSPAIKIDMTPPTITLSKDDNGKFIADADDAMSGIYYVAFDSEPTGELPNLPYTDTTSPYEWLFTGIRIRICNYMIKATAYDHAGNHAESNILSTPQCRNLQQPSNLLAFKILEKLIDHFSLLQHLLNLAALQ